MVRLTWLPLVLLLLSLSFTAGKVHAVPSTEFKEINGEWYDDWDVNRNYYGGSNGYLPNMAYETIEMNRELAFSIGESFKAEYPSRTSRAEAILTYVQTWTEYGYDEDNVYKNGAPQYEWAWNADEMAHAFDETTGVQATGDCEDMAFLCATIFLGADIDAAVVDAPEHVACLIWMPEYSNANRYWDLADGYHDGAGWIWVEATGETNPVGWTPPDFTGGDWSAYPISRQGLQTSPVVEPEWPLGGFVDLDTTTIAIIVFVAFVVLLLLGKAGSR
jgi:hypothetical protein